ncbi:MAG: hypothetical protein ACE5PV_05120 [Candidatus Poribacteria bacterium]
MVRRPVDLVELGKEDIDIDVILTERPKDLVDRSYRIRRHLREQGLDVLIDYLLSDDAAFSLQKKISKDITKTTFPSGVQSS